MQKIKTGDTVIVTAGADRGTRGEVLRVDTKTKRVVIEGVNIVKKHQRPQQAGRQNVTPGIIEFEAPIDVSNVQLICTECDEKTRVGFRINEDGRKVRVCRKCNADIAEKRG